MEMLIPDCNYPFVVFDNVLSEEVYNNVLSEIKLLECNSKPPEKTGSAQDAHGNALKRNSGVWLGEVYADYEFSHICNAMLSFYRKEVVKQIVQQDNAFIHLDRKELKFDVLLTNYSEGDYYKMHSDTSLFTTCLWLWEEPKSFEGGEFLFHFDERIEEVEIKNNRLVIFPGHYRHSVNTVTGSGSRYTISTFTSI